jgi:hypothetical protein
MKKNLVVVALAGALAILWCSSLFAQWSTDQILSPDDNAFSKPSYNNLNNAWQVAASGDEVHVIWCDERWSYPNREIYYRHSTNEGWEWDTEYRLSNDPNHSLDPALAVSGQVVHTVWLDERENPGTFWFNVWYRRYLSGWGNEVALTSSHYAGSPSIAVTGQNVHLAWTDSRFYQDLQYDKIYYRRSTNNGGDPPNWEQEQELVNNFIPLSGGRYARIPSIGVSDQQPFPWVHLVWQDEREGYGTHQIYYKRSTNNGAPGSWSGDTRLSLYDPG